MKRRNRQGMTLIEVLLALVIVGIGLLVLVTSVSRCLAVAKKARQYEYARRLLGEVDFEQPLQLEEEIEEGTQSGRFDGDFSNYGWERTVEKEGDDEESALYRVTTRVTWADRNREGYEEVVTYLHLPELEDE